MTGVQTCALPISNPYTKIPIDVYNSPNREIPDPFILPGLKKHKIPSNLVDSLNFENYVEGDCNRLARTAGWAVSKSPVKTAFNPLFIYSDVGLGKTHLAHAIGLQTKVNFPEKTVVYINSDLFYQQFIEAVKNNNRNDFILFYQSIDVLIIDDIQFLEHKEKTQDEFFHTLNTLKDANKQIVISSEIGRASCRERV